MIPRMKLPVLLLLLSPLLQGCDLIREFLGPSDEEAAVQAALDVWAAPGRPFMAGAAGRDTVISRVASGDNIWDVTVAAAPQPRVWVLQMEEPEIFPVVPGEAFSAWLGRRARELGMRAFLPQDVSAALRDGRIRGVAVLRAVYGRADQSGRNSLEAVAYLVPQPDQDPVWRLQPVSRSTRVLQEALRTTYDDMTFTDDAVMECMGSAGPASVPRRVQLSCVGEVLQERLGGGV